MFFGEGSVTDYETARTADHRAYARFFHGMLERAYLPPSGYEAWFPGAAHGDIEIERTAAARKAATSGRR